MMLATITARYSSITSWNVNREGSNMSCRATPIIPLEKDAPSTTPTDAMVTTTLRLAARHPTAEFKKLQASLLTPTIRPDTESTASMPKIT